MVYARTTVAVVAAQRFTQPQIEKPEESKSNLTDNTLAISAFVLDALQRASRFAPIPFLQIAASAALSIVLQAQVSFCD